MLITINSYQYNTDNITHAVDYGTQADIFPVDYHKVRLIGHDAMRMIDALKASGFVGTGDMINPKKVSVLDGVGQSRKLWLVGADKVLFISEELAGEIEKALTPASLAHFPAPESSSPEHAPVEKAAKLRTKKGSE